MSVTAPTVRDDPPHQRYELLLDGEYAGELVYRMQDGVVTLIHTEIAPQLSGQGLGERLVAGALADLRARSLQIVPVCPFVTAYLRRHPEDADLVARRGPR